MRAVESELISQDRAPKALRCWQSCQKSRPSQSWAKASVMSCLMLDAWLSALSLLQVSKVSAAAPPSCMCAVGPEVIFLGSCAGDSLLLHALPEQQAKSEVCILLAGIAEPLI